MTPHQIDFKNITVVLQGPVVLTPAEGRPTITAVIDSIRRHLPGATLVLATWRGPGLKSLPVDVLLELEDPGVLPIMKSTETFPSNANRQIHSTQRGLAEVKTPFAIKMRTDCLLNGDSFLKYFDAFPARDAGAALFHQRIISLTCFTVNPRTLEPVPFHLSDIFQFGRADDLRLLWSCPLISVADATFFTRVPHRPGVAKAVRAFNFRYGVEAHIFLHALRTRFEIKFDSVDDVDAASILLSERYLANNAIIVSPDQAGVTWLKYAAAIATVYQRFNCYSHDQWQRLYQIHSGGVIPACVGRHVRLETLWWWAFKTVRRIHLAERLARTVKGSLRALREGRA